MGTLKRKLKLLAGPDGGNNNPTPKKTPGNGGRKKRAATDDGNDPGTPSKKPRTPKGKDTGGKKVNGSKGMALDMGLALGFGMGIEVDENLDDMKVKPENEESWYPDMGLYDDSI
jgi:hypothetical protein